MPHVALLGPQRRKPTVSGALKSLGIGSGDPVSVVTAGWQEREGEVDELGSHLACDVTDLALYRRAEEAFSLNRELFRILRRRQDRLKELQRLYRIRLSSALDVTRRLLGIEADPRILRPQQQSALQEVRALDRSHLLGVRAAHAQARDRLKALGADELDRHRAELARILDSSAALLVAGGHVAVLLNRLRLFDLHGLLGQKPIVAWSAGAMAISERIVLFHDRPPQGAGDAEVLESGLGLVEGILPLPHAQRRLKLDDEMRVSLFARRFRPSVATTLDEEAVLFWEKDRCRESRHSRRLTTQGRLVEVEAA